MWSWWLILLIVWGCCGAFVVWSIQYDSIEIPPEVDLDRNINTKKILESVKMNNKKTLVIVDFQKDFYDKENGSLYVPGAEKCIEPIVSLIKNGDFQEVVLTLDFHELEDKSFKVNGGIWPVHCVQYSSGASIHPEIMNALSETKIPYTVFIKGNNPTHEEYGAFEKCNNDTTHVVMFANNLNDCRAMFSKSSPIVITGLAGDYCVLETYKNLKKMNLDVTPDFNGIAFIDPEMKSKEEYV